MADLDGARADLARDVERLGRMTPDEVAYLADDTEDLDTRDLECESEIPKLTADEWAYVNEVSS
jgi:hypothetical protein